MRNLPIRLGFAISTPPASPTFRRIQTRSLTSSRRVSQCCCTSPSSSSSTPFDEDKNNRNHLTRIDPANVISFEQLGGYLRYTSPDSFGRPTGLTALITKDIKQARIGTSAQSSIHPAGWNCARVVNRNRCHLLAKSLGGSGNDHRNLVTCFRTMNSPVMSYYEELVARFVDAFPEEGVWRRNKGVRYSVKPIYGERGLFPEEVEIKAEMFRIRRENKVLFHVRISNCDNPIVEFLDQGTFPQRGPPFLAASNIIPYRTNDDDYEQKVDS